MAQPPTRDWTKGLFDCFDGSWLMGWCCPCILYSQNSYRLIHRNLDGHSPTDTPCLTFTVVQYLTCCLGSFLIMTQRGEVRGKAGLPEDSGNDCLSSFCCPCCALIQQEQEIEALQGGQVPYNRQPAMSYQQSGPPPQQPQPQQQPYSAPPSQQPA